MANSYNSMPIILDTDIATGWRANQTLNTGNLPSNIQQTSGAVTRQWGIRVTKVEVISNGVTIAGTVTITDPKDGTVLFPPVNVPANAGASGTVIQREDFENHFPAWRDFIVTGLTATVTKLIVWYRA